MTAFTGAAPLISNKTCLDAAVGVLAAGAYHAASVRTELYERGGAEDADAISRARAGLNPGVDVGRGLTLDGQADIVPDGGNGIGFGRAPGQVLSIVCLTPGRAASGGFCPRGRNGEWNTGG